MINDQWYPGVIEKIEDGILTTKFLSRTKSGYCLVTPIRPEDTQEIIPEQVLCKIEPPTFKEIRGKKMYYKTKEQEIFIKNDSLNFYYIGKFLILLTLWTRHLTCRLVCFDGTFLIALIKQF